MLVLTRRKNQTVVVGHDIVITVLEVKGDQIRLGIAAPRDVPVYRGELLAALCGTDEAGPATDPAGLASPPGTGAQR